MVFLFLPQDVPYLQRRQCYQWAALSMEREKWKLQFVTSHLATDAMQLEDLCAAAKPLAQASLTESNVWRTSYNLP